MPSDRIEETEDFKEKSTGVWTNALKVIIIPDFIGLRLNERGWKNAGISQPCQ
jgi:hypothetical protein